MDDRQFKKILQYFGLSWGGYRRVRKGVKKRIRRHMHLLGCHDISGYLRELDRSYKVRHECELLMTVSISRFFRDRKLWHVLETEILPGFIEKRVEKIHVWSAGCASGEEVYTLKILWDGLKASASRFPKVEITATDMNPAYLERAKAGVYTSSSLKAVPEVFRSVYFMAQAGTRLYTIRTSMKSGVIWQVGHLLFDEPDSQFDLIFLRNNLLTYYLDEFKKPALGKVISHLFKGGLLIIGSHEKLPPNGLGLFPTGSLSYVLKKIN
jgi:chemotaxis protein methyltransferase CheR